MREQPIRIDEPSLDEHAGGLTPYEAARRAMERSPYWEQHMRHHREEGTSANLIIVEEPAIEQNRQLAVAPATFEDLPESKPRAPHLTGYCNCQSPIIRMVLGDRGVENHPVAPIETNSYGVVASSGGGASYSGSGSGAVDYGLTPGTEAQPLYGASSAPAASPLYGSAPQRQGHLYKGSNNSLYQ